MQAEEQQEREERGLGLPIVAMPPPLPVLAKTVVPSAESASSELQRDRTVFNKRPYSEVQDEHEETGAAKLPRTNNRGSRTVKEEDDDMDLCRPRSSGYDPSHRSAQRRPYGDGRGRGRGRGRSNGSERDMSPGMRFFEDRPPPRRRSESPLYDYSDHDEDHRGTRPFEVHGGYRGRAYDPNYRSRGGRGRGRGDSELRNESSTSFGSHIANRKPYKVNDFGR